MNKGILVKTILLLTMNLFFAIIHLNCSSPSIAGGGTEGGNVNGIIAYTNGDAASGVQVQLIPSLYNPVTGNATSKIQMDTTTGNGRYEFSRVNSGSYNIMAVDLAKRTRTFISGINVADDTVTVPVDTVRYPGAVEVFLPDTVDTLNTYLYIQGTTIYTKLSKAVLDSGEYSIAIDSIPSGTYAGFHFYPSQNPLNPVLVSDTIDIIPNDTSVTSAFIFWVTYSTSNSGLPDMQVGRIFLDNDGSLWFATYQGGAAHVTGSTWTIYNKTNSLLPSNAVSTIFRDSDGGLWITTFGGGIAVVRGSLWDTIKISNSGLPSNFIIGYAKDKNGNKWFATNKGAAKYDGINWTIYDSISALLPSNELNGIAVDSSNTVWCCSFSGVSGFDGTTWKNYTTSNSGIYTNSAITILVDSRKNVWFGHDGVLSKFDGTNWNTYSYNPDMISRIFDLFEDTDNQIWIGTRSGLLRFNGNQFYEYNGKRFSLLDNKEINAVKKDKSGNVWVGTYDSGVIGFGPTIK